MALIMLLRRFRFLPDTTTPIGLVTNAYGFRGAPVPLARQPKTIRIAFIGASTTVSATSDDARAYRMRSRTAGAEYDEPLMALPDLDGDLLEARTLFGSGIRHFRRRIGAVRFQPQRIGVGK